MNYKNIKLERKIFNSKYSLYYSFDFIYISQKVTANFIILPQHSLLRK